MYKYCRLSGVRKYAAMAMMIAAIFSLIGCDLDERTSTFIQETVESVVNSATENFILTPINNFITGQVDQILQQFGGGN